MLIDWSAFTPYSALIGGVLIGLASAMLIMCVGRVAGISGIVGDYFLVSIMKLGVGIFNRLLLAPWLYQLFAVLPPIKINNNIPLLIIVRFIGRLWHTYGSGCTSGHGVVYLICLCVL